MEKVTEEQKSPVKSTYKVLTNLRHNQKHIASGKEVMLTKKEAAPLLERGVIELIK